MPTKLFIYTPGRPSTNGFRLREFIWNAAHRFYVYGGKEIDAKDFNAIYERVVRQNRDMQVMVKVIPEANVAPAVKPPPPAILTRAAPAWPKKKPVKAQTLEVA